ncbi:MAG: alpha/beta hydrolase [Panacibacter sp.]
MKYILLSLFIIITASCFAQQSKLSSLLSYKLLPGMPDSVYEGYYNVFENSSKSSGKKISLYIIVIPSINKTERPPIFMTEGGPGVSVTNGAAFYADPRNIYRQNNDVVLIDARGTGKSNPLHCFSLQQKENLQEQMDEMYSKEKVKACYELLSNENDLSQYNTTNVVKDLEEVRKWLGYKKIHISGLSYGTKVCLQYVRMYPQVLASAVLWSPVPTYARMPLYHAKFAQQALEKIWQDCKENSGCNQNYPNISTEFINLMQRWKQKPVTYIFEDSSGTEQHVIISWDAFHSKLRSLMYTPAGVRTIPYIVHEAWENNLQPFIDLFPKGKGFNDFIAEGFYLCVTCMEDVPFIDPSQIALTAQYTFTGDYRVLQQIQACANWSKAVVSKEFLLPVKSTVPTLIISGSFDPVTPTSWAKEIAKTLSNSTLVVIPYMSHLFDGLSNEDCFDNMVVDFITYSNNQKLQTGCVNEMKPPVYK